MGTYLGRTGQRHYDDVQLGCADCGSLGEPVSTTVAVASSIKAVLDTGILGRIFGGSRDEKRKKRDQAINELHNRGMDRDIYLHHSDNWGVARGYADLAKEYGQVVTDVLNQNIQRDTAGDGKTGRWIYSAESEQFKMMEQKLTEAIMNEQQSSPSLPSLPNMPGMPGGAQAAGFGATLKHPMVIASAVVGGGAIAYSLLKD